MEYLQIKDTPEYLRDMKSSAIVRVDKKELNDFNLRRKKIIDETKEREETKERLCKLENDISCIKNLLEEIAAIRLNNVN